MTSLESRHALNTFCFSDHALRCSGSTISTRHTTVEGQASLPGGGEHAFQRGHQTCLLSEWHSATTKAHVPKYQGPARPGCFAEC